MFGAQTAADSWKSVSGNALFSFMTDGFLQLLEKNGARKGINIAEKGKYFEHQQ